MEISRAWNNLWKESMCPGFTDVIFYCLILSAASPLSSLFAASLKIGNNVFVAYTLAVRRRKNFLVISS